MSQNNILINDTVRIKVKFVDTNPATGDQTEVYPATVNVTIKNLAGVVVLGSPADPLTGSEYYIDFTPTIADTYTVTFIGVLSPVPPEITGKSITVQQQLYVSDADNEYLPTVTLKADEVITFAPDVTPLFVDPEEILVYFPDASLLEAGELIHHYSLEVKQLFNLTSEDGSGLSFNVTEYIKAATCCELSRTYGFGGDDELALQLGDLSITNRSMPRTSVNRGNATTWCQIAAALRKEIVATRVSMRGVVPKNLPSKDIGTQGKNIDSQTGAIVYLSDRELYGSGRKPTNQEDPMPDRNIRKYD